MDGCVGLSKVLHREDMAAVNTMGEALYMVDRALVREWCAG